MPATAGMLVEVAGNGDAVASLQKGPMAAKVGVMPLEISILMVATAAHCPAAGVKV